MKTLFGGSSGGGGTTSQTSGYSALPAALKASFDPLGQAVGQYTNPNNPGVINSFTPAPLSTAEQGAVSNVNAGFAPTSSSVASDMALQMNPYNDSVISEINRQGQGDYSVLKQAMDSAGQTGSNRSLLGANDIDLSRQNLIGSFLGNQFNTSMNNALTTLPQARTSDAMNQLNIGDLLRKLDLAQKQAPVTALQAGTGMLAPFMAGGTQSGVTQGTNTQNGIVPGIASLFALSDPRLKENITPKGTENGHNIYEFNYRGEKQKYIGVMADEVQKTYPQAVGEIHGFLAVNYPMIGVNFREA